MKEETKRKEKQQIIMKKEFSSMISISKVN
jgi:hypothetical protein